MHTYTHKYKLTQQYEKQKQRETLKFRLAGSKQRMHKYYTWQNHHSFPPYSPHWCARTYSSCMHRLRSLLVQGAYELVEPKGLDSDRPELEQPTWAYGACYCYSGGEACNISCWRFNCARATVLLLLTRLLSAFRRLRILAVFILVIFVTCFVFVAVTLFGCVDLLIVIVSTCACIVLLGAPSRVSLWCWQLPFVRMHRHCFCKRK